MQPINRRRTVSKVAIQERNTKPAKVPVSNLDMPEEESVLRLQATGEQLKRLRYTKTDLVLYSALTAIFFLVVIIGIIVWR